MRVRLLSPVLGTVSNVLAETGAVVTKGDVLIIIESMKMMFEIPATMDGKVEVIANLGQLVDSGEIVAYINQ